MHDPSERPRRWDEKGSGRGGQETGFSRGLCPSLPPECPPPQPLESTALGRAALTSSSRPVCMDQMKISKESWAPAETISPLESTATQENWVGLGDVKVRKFRYLREERRPGWHRAPRSLTPVSLGPERHSVAQPRSTPQAARPPGTLSLTLTAQCRGTTCFEPETEQKGHL